MTDYWATNDPWFAVGLALLCVVVGIGIIQGIRAGCPDDQECYDHFAERLKQAGDGECVKIPHGLDPAKILMLELGSVCKVNPVDVDIEMLKFKPVEIKMSLYSQQKRKKVESKNKLKVVKPEHEKSDKGDVIPTGYSFRGHEIYIVATGKKVANRTLATAFRTWLENKVQEQDAKRSGIGIRSWPLS